MIMSFEGYQEALESQSKKEDKLKAIKEQFDAMQSQIQALIAELLVTQKTKTKWTTWQRHCITPV
jgi:hypothetical protein